MKIKGTGNTDEMTRQKVATPIDPFVAYRCTTQNCAYIIGYEMKRYNIGIPPKCVGICKLFLPKRFK